MRIAVAQTRPVTCDVAANIDAHARWIHRATADSASLLFFPELSLLGYEPKHAARLALDPDDRRLDVLERLSHDEGLTVGVGAPLRGPLGVRIAMVIFAPGATRRLYCKQHLHADEMPYFVSGEGQLTLASDGETVAPAICYESLLPEHSDCAAACGATIYVASAAKSASGTAKAYSHYPAVARRHSMPVLMANSVGQCDDFVSVGQSAIWGADGALLAQLGPAEEGLLLLDTDTSEALVRPE